MIHHNRCNMVKCALTLENFGLRWRFQRSRQNSASQSFSIKWLPLLFVDKIQTCKGYILTALSFWKTSQFWNQDYMQLKTYSIWLWNVKGQKNNTEDEIKSFDNNEHQSNTWGNVQYFHTHHCFPKNLTLFSTKKLVSKGRAGSGHIPGGMAQCRGSNLVNLCPLETRGKSLPSPYSSHIIYTHNYVCANKIIHPIFWGANTRSVNC